MAHRYSEERQPLLSSGGVSRPNSYDSSSRSLQPHCNWPLALPDGKTHHLFFSHSSDDQQWVQACVERLEEIYDIRCLWPPRDFTPGKPIINLIEDGMSRAMKIVIVLSPEYIESGWCSYERHLAFVLSVQERQNCIIPVMLNPCQVPDVLRTVNYIDVTKGENVIGKICDALYQKCELKDILPNFNRQYHLEDVNGVKISVAAEKVFKSRFRGLAWEFKSLTLYQHQLLTNMGSEISNDTHDLAVTSINNLFFMRSFSITKRSCYFICLTYVFLVFLTGILSVIIVHLAELEDGDMFIMIAGSAFIALLIQIPFYIVIHFTVRKKGIKKAETIVKNISLNWYQQTKLFLQFHPNSIPTLCYMYYDTKPCQLYIRDCFLRLYAASPEDAQKEALASKLADHHLTLFLENNYDRILEWNNLDESLSQRHATMMRKQCLCEMVERDLWPQQTRLRRQHTTLLLPQ